VVRDKTTLRYGDLICTFMKTLSQSNLVIVVLNAKVPALDLPHDRAARPLPKRQAGKARIPQPHHPAGAQGRRIGTWRDRAGYAEHWESEFKAMEQHLTRLGEENLTLRKIFIILGIKPDLPCIEFGGSFCFVLEAR